MEELKDLTLTCKDCERDFLFTVSEQEFFMSKIFNDPQRCPDCRRARKKERRDKERSNYNNY